MKEKFCMSKWYTEDQYYKSYVPPATCRLKPSVDIWKYWNALKKCSVEMPLVMGNLTNQLHTVKDQFLLALDNYENHLRQYLQLFNMHDDFFRQAYKFVTILSAKKFSKHKNWMFDWIARNFDSIPRKCVFVTVTFCRATILQTIMLFSIMYVYCIHNNSANGNQCVVCFTIYSSCNAYCAAVLHLSTREDQFTGWFPLAILSLIHCTSIAYCIAQAKK